MSHLDRGVPLIAGLLISIGVLLAVTALIGGVFAYRRHWFRKYLQPVADAYDAELDLFRGHARLVIHKVPVVSSIRHVNVIKSGDRR